eukprot:9335371-Karenia_brevis.AAC.1
MSQTWQNVNLGAPVIKLSLLPSGEQSNPRCNHLLLYFSSWPLLMLLAMQDSIVPPKVPSPSQNLMVLRALMNGVPHAQKGLVESAFRL